MKTLYQIFLAGFILLVLFVVKDDFRTEYNKILIAIEGDKYFSEVFSNANIDKQKVELKEQISDTSLKLIETPGALRVIDKVQTVIDNNINKSELTKEGVIKETNLNRYANGKLAPLAENSKLNFSAEKKLQDMFAKQYFEHVSPSGISISELGNQIGYDYILIGENLALGNFGSDKALVDAWMASPGHRENILNKKYTEIGVAVGQGKFEGRTVWMAVQHFGLPQSACPSIDQVLLGVIQLNEREINKMTAELASLRKKINSGGVYDGQTQDEQINQYNILVNIYNKLISDSKKNIDNYNQQVKNFNSCISSNT